MSRSVIILCIAAAALLSASEQPHECGRAMRPPVEEVFVYEFLANHAPVAPRAVLATGSASGAAVWAACRSDAHGHVAVGAPTTLAVALVSTTPTERFATNTSLLFVRATLAPRRRASNRSRFRNATAPVAGEQGGVLVRSARLRTLEAHHRARFDWIVLDEATANVFSASGGALKDLCADGSPRVVVARYESPPSDAHRAAVSGGDSMKNQPWVEIRVHPRFLVYSCL